MNKAVIYISGTTNETVNTFYKTRERMEHIKKKHLEASKPKADVPKKPDNILVYKTKCACCGGSVLIGRHHTYSDKFYYKCKNRRKLARFICSFWV